MLKYALISDNKITFHLVEDIEDIAFDLLGPAWFNHSRTASNYIGISSQLNYLEAYQNTLASKLFKEDIYGDCLIIVYDNLEDEYHSVDENMLKNLVKDILDEV